MDNNKLNFALISKALSCSLKALKEEETFSSSAMKDLQEAQKLFQQALSVSPQVEI